MSLVNDDQGRPLGNQSFGAFFFLDQVTDQQILVDDDEVHVLRPGVNLGAHIVEHTGILMVTALKSTVIHTHIRPHRITDSALDIRPFIDFKIDNALGQGR
ncbi:hypothetical protein D3C73_1093100 [compost metagenome]